jgi:hypothetical protein
VKLVQIEAIGRSAGNFKEMANNNNGLNISSLKYQSLKVRIMVFGALK